MNAVGIRSARPLSMMLKHQQAAVTRCYSTDTAIPDPESRADLATASPTHRIAASVVLSRPPVLTADLTPFEESFYFYQRRLNMRTALPFTRYFYHKKDSPSDLEWKAKQLAAGESYTGFGKRQWADELLVGDNSHKSEDNGYKRLVETTVTGEDATLKEVEGGGRHPGLPLSRRTKADEENDRKSLDRAMSKTLYFLVKTKEEEQFAWKFPETVLVGRENLKEAAQRALAEAAGVNMNTWFVGNVPIGHNVYARTADSEAIGKKVFYMKARIMAGQANLSENTMGLEDFVWVTKDEIPDIAGNKYFKSVQHMLVQQ